MKNKFWKGKIKKCKNCGSLNMEYWIKLNKICGNCGKEFEELRR